ncbi:hypothetical protein U27_06596 [Candidatus Vecturithrix granuli]|uniref:Uncharacterized protein n=1 Tax=Vecturithrix granuli TaxID=1499967 RepID=A0A081C4V6_VECG1|nr:hypothetical protein U27_06596 [Candidatus Vecturithrix granuli]
MRMPNKAFAGDFEGRRGKWVAKPDVQWPPPLEAPETRALACVFISTNYNMSSIIILS